MDYELRTLDSERDEEMFKLAYDWIFTRPDWFQYMDGVASVWGDTYSFDSYLKSAKDPAQYSVGLFNGQLRALFTIQDRKDGSFEVHVNAEKGVDQMALAGGAIRLREWLFANGAREIFGWLASVNRPMHRFAEQAGFTYCGVSIFRGSLNDKPLRWLRFMAVK